MRCFIHFVMECPHFNKPYHYLQEMMPYYSYSIYIIFSICAITYCLVSFRLIMQNQLVLKKYDIFVIGIMY